MRFTCWTFVAISLCLTACGKNEGQSAVPEHLNPAITKEITAQRTTDPVAYKKIFAMIKQGTQKWPSTKLIFDNSDGSVEQERIRARLDRDGENLLNKIKSHCSISKPTTSSTGTYESGHQMTSVTTSSVGGENCPIDYNSKYTESIKVMSLDRNSGALTGTGSFSEDTSNSLKDSALRKSTSIRGDVSSITGTFVSENFSRRGNSGAWYTTMNFTSNPVHDSVEKGNVTGQSEEIVRGGHIDGQTLFRIELNGNVLYYGVVVTGPVKRVFVNGTEITPQQVKDLLGVSFEDLTDFDCAIKN